jgi:adenosylmethionine-8-amino-7-oxononanoate aminotransferase
MSLISHQRRETEKYLSIRFYEPSQFFIKSISMMPHSSSLSTAEISRLDQQHVWHPYAAMPNSIPCFPVESAQGCELTLTDGRVLVDGMSSWWAAIHGHSHPVLREAATQQLDKLSHVMFGGLTHEPAVKLAQALAEIAPGSGMSKLDKVFYCDSGSVAIEVGMKMALQYWYNLGLPQKSKFLTVRGGYHGDTFEAMSVCDPDNGMHHLFQSVLPTQLFAPQPTILHGEEWDESDIYEFQQIISNRPDEIAAVILEPIVQGAGGMRFYSPQYLKRVRELCDNHDVLLICDEIATGFGRTGKMFAVEHAKDVAPDIMCIGKALSGGFLSFAATLTSQRIAEVFSQGPAGVLMHGPTFMGNPLACAVSLASLNLLQSYDLPDRIGKIERQLKTELEPLRDSPLVHDVRVLGAIGVVEMKEPMDMKVVQPQLVDHGVWLRPFGKLLYTMPPFVIQPHELRKITKAMVSLATRRRI